MIWVINTVRKGEQVLTSKVGAIWVVPCAKGL